MTTKNFATPKHREISAYEARVLSLENSKEHILDDGAQIDEIFGLIYAAATSGDTEITFFGGITGGEEGLLSNRIHDVFRANGYRTWDGPVGGKYAVKIYWGHDVMAKNITAYVKE